MRYYVILSHSIFILQAVEFYKNLLFYTKYYKVNHLRKNGYFIYSTRCRMIYTLHTTHYYTKQTTQNNPTHKINTHYKQSN